MANVAKRKNPMLKLLAAGVETAGVAAGAAAAHIVHSRQAAKDFNDEPADHIVGSWGDGRVAKEPADPRPSTGPGGWGPPPTMEDW